jgi:hypothetical protein
MRVARVDDFSMNDVEKPDPKRTMVALSALINFAKFREEHIGNYTQKTANLVSIYHTVFLIATPYVV